MTAPLLEVRGLGQRYGGRQVLRDIAFTLPAGESLGVIGESGAGKSTLARLLMALERPRDGRVLWSGEDVNALPAAARRALRSRVQMVFQDPYGSLDPRWRVGRSVMEPLASRAMTEAQRLARVAEVLIAVGLEPDAALRFPHQFSGGQRQRLAIARALSTQPRLIVADEPLSALDVSVQAQILNLLRELQRSRGLSYLFITHNIGVVEYIADEVAVMQAGRIVEAGRCDAVLGSPTQAYTRTLLAAVPRVERQAG